MKKKNKTLRRVVWIAVILLIIGGAAAYRLTRPKATTYDSLTAEQGDIFAYYSFTGNVEAKTRQAVLSEKALQVAELLVKEGQTVNAGDVLIRTAAGDEIKAATGGEVANIKVDKNSSVLGGVKLLELVDYSSLRVNVKVDEFDLGAVTEGKTATVRLNALGRDITGAVSAVSREGTVASNVTYFTASISLPYDPDLRIGMSAEVRLLADKAEGVVTLPIGALQFDAANKPYVLIGGEKGKAVRQDVTVGINDGIYAEIKSGIEAGQTVLYTKSASAGSDFFNRSRSGSSNTR